jgi:hypothetical protein
MFKAQIDFKKYICPQVSVLSAMSDSAVFKWWRHDCTQSYAVNTGRVCFKLSEMIV